MSDFNWGNYAWAYKAIHDKLEEVLQKLDTPTDPQLVDILAETIGELQEVNVLFTRESHVSNFGQIINGDFESWYVTTSGVFVIPGWVFVGDVSVYSGSAFSGLCCVCLQDMGQPLAFKGMWQFLSPSIPTNYIRSFTLMYKCTAVGNPTLFIDLYYSDGSKSPQEQAMPRSTQFSKLDLTYDPNKFIIAIHIYTDYTEADRVYVDSVSLNYQALPQIPINLLTGQQTVAAAGTPVTLGSGAILHSILIQPMPTNTGNILVGNSSGQVFVLTPTSEAIRVFAKDLGDVYIDASVNGEGVNYIGG